MGIKTLLFTQLVTLSVLACFSPQCYAQRNAYKWTFNKFDKNGDGRLTFREFKNHAFFKFDHNNDLKLSRFEFWRLKMYTKRELRTFERKLRLGRYYPEYYKYALQPLVVYQSDPENNRELMKINR